jgi:hypothetical protein
MNENLRIPAAIMPAAMLMPGGARPRHLRCMLEGERDGIEEFGYISLLPIIEVCEGRTATINK